MGAYGISILVVIGIITILFALRNYFNRSEFEIGDDVLVDNQYPGHVVDVKKDSVIVRVELPNRLVSKKEEDQS
jgi:hypothetical protein